MRLPDKESLLECFEQYTDDQLMEVLRNSKHYQDQAVEAAVETALKRALIHSRQDLFSGEFNRGTPLSKHFFPLLDAKQTSKMMSSLFRILYLVAVIPVVFLVLRIVEGDFLQAVLWGAGTAGWIVVNRMIGKKRMAGFVFFLFLFLFYFHFIYFFGYRSSFQPGMMDVIVYLMPLLVLVYLLGYLFVLLRRGNR
ncbi:MAG: hypothetical protein PHI28_09000 [Mangrovibacterium sp.]|nr:hypothetical protein [Mangrovibacterium sp.]